MSDLWTHTLPHGTYTDPEWGKRDFFGYKSPHEYIKAYWQGLHGYRNGCKTMIEKNTEIHKVSCMCNKHSAVEYKILKREFSR